MQDTITTGVLLTGGEGTRLRPFTTIASKQLYPIGDKFVIDFPLQTLKNLGVKDLIIVLGGSHHEQVVEYVRDGKHLGFNSCSYVFQSRPEGLSQAISLCEHLVHTDKFYALLGDNIFDGSIQFTDIDRYGAQICLTPHQELKRFGVASLHDDKIVKIEEKPQQIDTTYQNYAISGLYLFDYHFFHYFKMSKKSARSEFEIVDIMKQYHNNKDLGFTIFNGMWADAGTTSAIKQISDYFWDKNK